MPPSMPAQTAMVPMKATAISWTVHDPTSPNASVQQWKGAIMAAVYSAAWVALLLGACSISLALLHLLAVLRSNSSRPSSFNTPAVRLESIVSKHCWLGQGWGMPLLISPCLGHEHLACALPSHWAKRESQQRWLYLAADMCLTDAVCRAVWVVKCSRQHKSLLLLVLLLYIIGGNPKC